MNRAFSYRGTPRAAARFRVLFAADRLRLRGETISKRTRDVMRCIKQGSAFLPAEQIARKDSTSQMYVRKVQRAAKELYARYPVFCENLMLQGLRELYAKQGREFTAADEAAWRKVYGPNAPYTYRMRLAEATRVVSNMDQAVKRAAAAFASITSNTSNEFFQDWELE